MAQINTPEGTRRAVSASKLRYQVLFSFTPDGPVCMAHHRFISPGKTAQKGYSMKLYFFMHNRFRCITYRLENAHKRILYLHDLGKDHSAKQYELDVRYVPIKP